MKKIAFLLVILFSGFNGFSQFEISAELRPRAEFRRGYSQLPGQDAKFAAFVSQRTRLNFFYTHEKFKIGVSLQDVRVWGDEQSFSSTGVFGDNASIDLNEGWIELKAHKNGALRFGRQYLAYEDERLMALRNWNQSSITYDALLYKWSPQSWDIHLAFSFNANKENVFGDDYNLYSDVYYFDTLTQTIVTKKITLSSRIKSQNFIYVKKQFNDSFHISLITMATGMQNPVSTVTVYLKGTYGLFGQYKIRRLFIRGSAYFQNGKNISGKSVSAYMFNAKGELKLDPFTVNAGLDYISGHNASDESQDYQDRDHFFDIFYGARHKYYGFMDYFNNMRVATSNGGLADLFAGVSYNLKPNIKFNLDYHYFSLQNFVFDPTTADNNKIALDKALGTEIDFTFDIKILPEVGLKGGYSAMLPTETMEKLQKVEAGTSGFAYWGWLMVTAKPTLLLNK
ncbi:MAG: alginate export family protein [Bacteroidales bacterium]